MKAQVAERKNNFIRRATIGKVGGIAICGGPSLAVISSGAACHAEALCEGGRNPIARCLRKRGIFPFESPSLPQGRLLSCPVRPDVNWMQLRKLSRAGRHVALRMTARRVRHRTLRDRPATRFATDVRLQWPICRNAAHVAARVIGFPARGPPGLDKPEIQLLVRPVDFVAYDRIAERAEVHTNLMSSPGMRDRANQCELIECARRSPETSFDPECRPGRGAFGVNRLFQPDRRRLMLALPIEGSIDIFLIPFRPTPDDREILFL